MTADPSAADAVARRDGLPRIERIKALRASYGLSLAEAKAVVDATDGRGPEFPEVADGNQLVAVLEAELGYCTCAGRVALPLLCDVLRLARERTDGTEDKAAFARAARELEALL